MPFLEQQAAAMNTSLVETQQANTALLPVVTAQRAEIEALVRGLEGVVADLEASAGIMSQDDVQGLGAEIRQIEKQMRT
jgi:kinetochore protein NNF1